MKKRKIDMAATKENQAENATFILQVKFRQNNSWQGTVEWVEEKKSLNFRSALELMKIIDSTNNQGKQKDLEEIDMLEEAIAK